MRFDAERVVALAETWTFPKLKRAEGERLAALEIAKQFEQAGLRVETIDTRPADYWFQVVVVAIAPCLGLLAFSNFVLFSVPLRLGFLAVIAFPLIGAIWLVDRLAGKTWHVLGRPAGEADPRPPVRVVFVSRISTRQAVVADLGMWLGWASILLYAGLLCTAAYARDLRSHPATGPSTLTSLALCSFWMVLVATWTARAVRGLNRRTNLALLAELARTWPERLGDRVETWFVASPNTFGLARKLAREAGPRPTLLIDLDAPEVGAKLVLAGPGEASRLAAGAARDLWLPHRRSVWGTALTFFMFLTRRMPCVSLRVKRDLKSSDPAILAAAAQLLTQVALRWAKQEQAVEPREPAPAP